MTDGVPATPGPGWRATSFDPPPAWLYLVTAAAVLLGLWARFAGIGAWPLNSDEYYIARSVEDILRTGLPEYDCGGYYTRGLLFQYVVAVLQWSGVSAEVSARVVAAAASVAALPAVYMLGKRLGGRSVGLLAVAAMAISSWEVDIARFGRMYAPFQAVFAWYVIYFLRHTVDRDPKALGPMLLLSVVGLLTWEGGVLLLLANLLPPFLRSPEGRLTRIDVTYIAAAAFLLVVGYYLTQMVDFRRIGTQSFPTGVDPDSFYIGESEPRLFEVLALTPYVAFAAVLLAILALASLRWAFSLRRRWPAALGLLAAVGAALAHQFSLVATIVVVLLLARMLHWRELLSRSAWPFLALVLASATAWSVYALAHPEFLATVDVPWNHESRALALAHELLRVPDYLAIVVLPWVRQAPLLGLLLAAGLVVAAVRVILQSTRVPDAEQVVLTLGACLLAAAAMSDPPRFETRYVFFLYPTAVVIMVTTAARLAANLRMTNTVATATTAAVIAGVMQLGGDLNVRRLVAVDSPLAHPETQVTRRASNVMRRTDSRSAARWLDEHARGPDTLVINSYPGVDFYFDDFDFAYIDSENQRYWAYACNEGRTERWGNLPLISTVTDLESQIVKQPRTLIVVDSPAMDDLLPGIAALSPEVAWVSADGRISIIEISRSAGHG